MMQDEDDVGGGRVVVRVDQTHDVVCVITEGVRDGFGITILVQKVNGGYVV